VEQAGEDYGYNVFMSTVDTVILGRKTYDWVMRHVDNFPHADKPSYVITRTKRPSIGNTHFYTGNLRTLITQLKTQPGNTIFCDGGAEIANGLLHEKLFDRLIISIIPILLGQGTRLFSDSRLEQGLTLLETKTFPSGLVQVHYRCL
jgi:dihydrofolate reductase